MDLLNAGTPQIALAVLSIATAGVALAIDRRVRTRKAEIDASADVQTRAMAKVRLLEFRAADLAYLVEELEQRRDHLVAEGAVVLDIRTALGMGGKRADRNVVVVDDASDESLEETATAT